MALRLFLFLALALWAAVPARADVDRLIAALRLPEVLSIMQQEGMAYGLSLDADLLQGRGGPDWAATVGRIYDPARMEAGFAERMRAALGDDPATVAAAIAFAESDLGQRALALEISARAAMLDEAVDAAARDAAAQMMASESPRRVLIDEFIAANDLMEQNVAGALNANLAFYFGFAEGGGIGADLSEDQILADVWAQEPDIRAETRDWLYAFLGMAYSPLSDDDLRAYTAFSRTGEGRRMNRALFAAFDAMFETISSDLGRAAGLRLSGQDL